MLVIVIVCGVLAVLCFAALPILYKRLLRKVDQWCQEGYR